MKKQNIVVAVILVSVLFLGGVSIADAATLSLSPASQEVEQGEVFEVNIVLDTEGESVNSVTSALNFDSSKLKLQGIDSSSSDFPEKAAESSADDVVEITRFVVPDPDVVSGSDLLVSTLSFELLSSDNASVQFVTEGLNKSAVMRHKRPSKDVLHVVQNGMYGPTAQPPASINLEESSPTEEDVTSKWILGVGLLIVVGIVFMLAQRRKKGDIEHSVDSDF